MCWDDWDDWINVSRFDISLGLIAEPVNRFGDPPKVGERFEVDLSTL